MIKDFKAYMRENFYQWIGLFCMLESALLFCDENYKWSALFGWVAFVFVSKHFFESDIDEVE